MPKTKVTTISTEECCPGVLTETLDEHDAAELARGFAALSDPTRLRLLNLLASAETGEISACDFVEPMGKSQPTVSHHLRTLTEAGLIVGDKRGRWIWYSLVPDRLEALRGSALGQPR